MCHSKLGLYSATLPSTPYLIIIHTKVKRGREIRCGATPNSVPLQHPCQHEWRRIPCILLSRDDDAAGGVSKRRRLETGQTLKAAKVWPYPTASPDTVEVRLSQRGARRRRATLSLSNGGGFSIPWSETPGTLKLSCVLKIDHPRELQLVPYPPRS